MYAANGHGVNTACNCSVSSGAQSKHKHVRTTHQALFCNEGTRATLGSCRVHSECRTASVRHLMSPSKKKQVLQGSPDPLCPPPTLIASKTETK